MSSVARSTSSLSSTPRRIAQGGPWYRRVNPLWLLGGGHGNQPRAIARSDWWSGSVSPGGTWGRSKRTPGLTRQCSRSGFLSWGARRGASQLMPGTPLAADLWVAAMAWPAIHASPTVSPARCRRPVAGATTLAISSAPQASPTAAEATAWPRRLARTKVRVEEGGGGEGHVADARRSGVDAPSANRHRKRGHHEGAQPSDGHHGAGCGRERPARGEGEEGEGGPVDREAHGHGGLGGDPRLGQPADGVPDRVVVGGEPRIPQSATNMAGPTMPPMSRQRRSPVTAPSPSQPGGPAGTAPGCRRGRRDGGRARSAIGPGPARGCCRDLGPRPARGRSTGWR